MRRGLLALALLGTSGCLATRSDIQLLQSDLVVMRQETSRLDVERRTQIEQLSALIRRFSDSTRIIQDSLTVLSARLRNSQGDQTQQMRAILDELVKLNELFGANQKQVQALRAAFEKQREMAAPPPTNSSTPPDTSGAANAPGPYQLFQIGKNQLSGQSPTTARMSFQAILDRFPTHELAAEAQFYVGDSYAQAKDSASADSSFAVVVEKYPTSPMAPRALYRRGMYHQQIGKKPEAKAFFEAVIAKYPKSDEAPSARERLKELRH